ncbi:MAG: alpha/beta hydrolase [Lentisphaeria bacterium]|nr:alpha/beta hydrolase [Lentisphaeria bacterium]
MNSLGTHVAETPSGPVEYLLEGASGPLILGIHGAPGSCGQMRAMFDRLGLVPGRCRRLFVSRPGYFDTPLDSGRSPAEQGDLFAALLDALEVPAVDGAVAFSCGGPSALEFAKRHPDRIRRLILLSAVTGPYRLTGDTFAGRLESFLIYSTVGMKFVELMSRHFPRAVFRQLLSGGNAPGRKVEIDSVRFFRSPEDRAFLLELIRQSVPFRRYAAGFRNDGEQMTGLSAAAYAGLTLPVLILHGRRDGDVNYRHAATIASVLPEAKLVTFEHGYHILALGRELFMMKAKITRFLELKRVHPDAE